MPRPLRIVFFNRSYWPDQAATGQLLTELAEDLVARHLHAPYAYPALRQTLHDAAVKSVQRYLDEHAGAIPAAGDSAEDGR